MEPIESRDELLGGGSSQVRLVDGVVYRLSRPWTTTVHKVLRFLEEEGFSGAPRVESSGLSEDGFETLSYIEGDDVPPAGLSEESAFAVGALLRSAHETLRNFTPSGDEVWMPWWGRSLPGNDRIIGHCDVAPWNLVCKNGVPIALVDWDSCGPVDLIWELAHAIWLNSQLLDEGTGSHGLPSVRDRLILARSICDGYGVSLSDRKQLPDAMIEVAVRTAAQEAIDSGVTEFDYLPVKYGLLGGGEPFSGHELTWAMTWRIRSARWLLDNRAALAAALEG
jgi:Phosphotransferase enzyme family